MTGRADAAHVLAAMFPDLTARENLPIVIVAYERKAVVWASTAARAVFGGADDDTIRDLLFGVRPTSRALVAAFRGLRPGEEPRLERLRLGLAWSAVPHLLMCRVVDQTGSEPLGILQWVAPARTGRPPDAVAGVPAVAPEASPAEPRREEAGPSRRLLWTTDRAGIVLEVDPAFGRAVGSSALAPGDQLSSRLEAIAPSLAAAVERVLAHGGAVAAMRLSWPREQGDPIEVEVGCARRRSPDGGLSGFCVLHEAADRPAPESPVPAAASGREATGENAASGVDGGAPVSPVAIDDTTAASLPAEPVLDPPSSPGPAAPFASEDLPTFAAARASLGSNVVHFPAMRISSVPANFGIELRSRSVEPPRPKEQEPDFGDLQAPRWAEDPEPARSSGELSADERDAFAHIGQVLGTRPATPQASDATARGTSPAATALESLAPFLDALPFGLLWQIDGATGANKVFREHSGFIADALPDDLVPETIVGPVARLSGQDGSVLEAQAHSGEVLGSSVRWFVLPEAYHGPSPVAVTTPALADAADLPPGTAGLDVAADGYAFLDDQGTITRINPSGSRLFGFEPGDLVGRPILDLASPDTRDDWEVVVAAVDTGVVSHALTGRSRTGQPIPLAVRLGRIAANGLFMAWTDDAERQQSLTGLEAARTEAERTSALKSEFLTRVSHEIRTPLNAILGFAEVIRDERLGPVGNSRYLDYLRDIHASGTHVMSLVNDLLDLSRIEAGRMDLQLEAVDANDVVNSCVNALQQLATRDRIIMRLSLSPGLPAALADERSLRQIVLNLLSNAIKFNEPGGQVIVSTAPVDSDAVAVRIRDTGIGMTDSEIEIAMEPFRQVSAVKRTGSGLGLPVTKALVEANCASMAIRSKPGQGTLVEVTFPVVERGAMSLPAE